MNIEGRQWLGGVQPLMQIVIEALRNALQSSGFNFMSFQHGGITPGSPNQSMLARLHGSETVVPASLRNAEFSLVNKLIAALGNVGNSFTVNASYQNMQSPATVSLDMSALMAMARN
jgi:hypothetical protein